MKLSELESLSSPELGHLVKLMHASHELFLEVVELSWMTDVIPDTHKEIYSGYDLMSQKKKDEMFLVCYRGYSKCLHGDSQIELSNGLRKAIKDISIGDKVLSLNNSLKFEEDVVSGKVMSGSKQILNITTNGSTVLRCTPEHKVYTFNGWKEAKDLTTEDRLASPRETPVFNEDIDISDDMIKFLIYMITEGSLTKGNCSFTNIDKEIIDDFYRIAERFGWVVTPRGKYGYAVSAKGKRKGFTPRDVLAGHGLMGHKSTEKRLPEFMFKLSKRQCFLIIEALMVTDGFFSKSVTGVTLANKELIDDFRRIFSRVGVVTTVYFSMNKYDDSGKTFPAWTCKIDHEGYKILKDNCYFMQKQEKANEVMNEDCYSLLDTYPKEVVGMYGKFDRSKDNDIMKVHKINPYIKRDTIRKKIRRILSIHDAPKVQVLEDADIWWSKITSIEDGGVVDTYDIEVEKNHNMISDGVVTHNSTMKRNVCIREICLGLSRFIVFVHETMDQAKADLDAIQQEIKSNSQIKFLFGDLSMAHDDEGRMVTKWASESARFYRRDNPSTYTEIKCIGMNKKFRGFHSGGMRINRLFFDDFESEDNTRTAEMRTHNLSQINAKILPARDPHNFWVVYQGTIVHPDSYMASVQKKVRDGIRCDANRETGLYFERQASSCPETYGVGTWPKRFSKKMWESIRFKAKEDKKYAEFLQEYYNIPIQAGDPRFDTDMITEVPYVFKMHGKLKWIQHKETGKKTVCKTFLGVDPAYSFAKRSDSTGMCVLATTTNGSYIILEVVYGKMKQDEKIKHIQRLHEKYGLDVVNIEAYGAALEMPQVLEDDNRAKHIRMNIELFNERVGKSKKYHDNLETYINSGKVSYVSGVEYIETMKIQMNMFSGEERYHDDLIDAVWLAKEKAELPYDIDIEKMLKRLLERERSKLVTGSHNPYDRMSEIHNENQRRRRR